MLYMQYTNHPVIKMMLTGTVKRIVFSAQ